MRPIRHVLVVFAILAGLPSTQASQQPSSGNDVAGAAGAAYEAKDWPTAARLYGELSQQPEAPPQVWLRLAAALRELGKYQDAIAAFEKANAAGAASFGEYGEAAAYTAMREIEKAFDHLEKAMQQGYAQPDAMRSDPSLAMLQNDPRFAKLLEQSKKNQRPCAYASENRQFDFWLGEWTVTTTRGAVPAGDSKIELILEDCVIQENWKSQNSPYSGKSYNIDNQAQKRWEQYWVDSAGGNIFFLRRTKGRRHGLFYGRNSPARRTRAETALAVYP